METIVKNFDDVMDYMLVQSWVGSHVEAIADLKEIKSDAAFYSLIMTLINMYCEGDNDKIVEDTISLFINTIKIHGGKENGNHNLC